MGNLHLVTGYAGQPHVTPSDHGSFFEALIRSGQFVMDAGANFAASVVTNNQIKVSDGELLMQGRHVKLEPGAYVDLTIENGSQGYLRNDLIVVRYTRDNESGIEECSLVVLKGTQAESNPSDPEYTTGSINATGALQHDFPLYRVPLSGLNVGELVALFKPQKSIFDAMLQMEDDAAEKFAPSGYGLGTFGKICTDCNTAKDNGWYSLSGESCLNTPPSYSNMKYGSMLVLNRSNSYVAQVIFYLRYITIRYSNDGGSTWTEWEHLNPPMKVNTEYRTAERYKETAVYKKVDANGNILWRAENETSWHLLASADYVATATVE